jgi:hypothetical protein
MIAMRPRSWCLRDVFADVLKGLHIAEEVMDTDMKDVTPRTPPPAPKAVQTITVATVNAEPETQTETSVKVENLIADWTQRLSEAPPEIQSEIFELEIDPYRERGNLTPQQYNALLALVSAT